MTGRLGRTIVAAIAATFFMSAQAQAGPADLDPSFGTGGLVIVPGTDRFDPEAAPLLRSDGKITVAGLLRNSSDRVFLARFGSGGAIDGAFGSGGEVHTNVVAAPDRRAHTAQLADGKIVVAGGADNKGTVTLERYLATGAPDGSFGANGKLSHTIRASYLQVVAAVAQPDGKTLVSAYTNHGAGYRSFVVMRFTGSGIDGTFGNGGVARVAFGTKNATAWDLALLANGKILAAGSVGDGDATNTAAVRLNPDGTLDTTFASAGRLERDASGAGKADYATGVLADASGAFSVTGPSTTTGMVARFASTGAPDAAFGTNGVKAGGFVPAGTTFTPADVVGDPAGRMVVVGTARVAATGATRWLVARVKTSGADPFDAGFGTAGVTQLAACANHNDFGPTGAAVSDAGRIVVLGACNDDGRVAAVRLLGLDPFPAAATASVAPASEAAGAERIPLANIEPAGVLGALETLQSSPIRGIPLMLPPIRGIPLESSPIRGIPIRGIPIRGIPIRGIPIRGILLSDIPIRGITWQELLNITGPLQSYTLEDALRINPDGVGDLTLDQIDLQATPIRGITVGALMLGRRPLSSLPAPAGGWCAFLDGKVDGCDAAFLDTRTLFELEAQGVDFSEYYATPLRLAPPTDLGSGDALAPIARIELRMMELSRTPYGAVPASSIGSLLKCGTTCTGTVADRQAADPENFSLATVGQLIAALPNPGGREVTLGDLLAGIVAPEEIPYESAPLHRILASAEFRGEDLQTSPTSVAVDCAQAGGLLAVPGLPGDARLVPGSAKLSVAGGAAQAIPDAAPSADAGGKRAYSLSGACAGRGGAVTPGVLTFTVEPGSVLGPFSGDVTVRSAYGSVSDGVSTIVDDSRDPGEGGDHALPLDADALVTGHIASKDDTDTYSFTPAKAGRVTLRLSKAPADFDLTVYGPNVGPETTLLPPIRGIPIRGIPIRGIPVPDNSREPTDERTVAPDTAQDIPIRGIPIRGISVNRETFDEAVTVVVRASDVGKRFLVDVTGYNGASDPKPYLLRRIDRPAPPAPECMAFSSLSTGAPGVFPTSVPSDTETLILVNQQRMAARENVLAATQTRSRLNALAAATKGVVVPVESDALRPTGSAYVAWDQNPCDPEKANDVADAILGVIGHVREMGDGLPELRNLVVVGPDDDIPMFREPDYAVLSNESDYAPDVVTRGRENTISAALRQGYLLSDDRYADVNPNTRLSVPDLAIGRLVETTSEIRAQVDSFLAADGVVDPKDAFVAGYDFLKDGSQAQFDALRTAVPAGAASSRIDETWDAALARDRLNRPNAGFTALNAHFSHNQALPAAAFSGEGLPDLFNATEADPAERSIVFTVGCHSGLNMSVRLDAPSAEEQLLLGDWAQKHAANAAMYAANTGYGYGDTDAVAWSERLMRDYAVNLASKKVTVGQAMMFAKQANAAALGIADDYWNKASMEATFYGLPMWRIGENGGVGASAVPAPLPEPATVTRIGEKLPTIVPAARKTTTDRGSFWVVPGHDPLAVQRRPIQPKMVLDVTPKDDLLVHGFLPEGFTTTDIGNVDPVTARPRVDLAAHEPEPETDSPLWPAVNFEVASEATPEGPRQRLTVIAGEFRQGTQRLFDSIDGRVLRSNSRDFEPLTIRRVDGALITGGFSVTVDVDDTDAAGGNIIYRTGKSTGWKRVNLALTGARRLGGGAALAVGEVITEAKVHVFDEAGNVSGSDNKVLGYSFTPRNDPAFPRITFSPANTGYYEDGPTMGIDPGPATGATYQYSIDGGPLTTFTGPFRVPEPDEGEHVVRVIGSDGSSTEARFAVDSQAPMLVAEISPAPNADGWHKGDVTVSFECADAVAGVQSCPAPVKVTGEGRELSVTGSATDRAGHTGSLEVTGIDIDRTAPAVKSAPDRAANADDWYAAPVTFTFACTDALSGVGFCSAAKGTGAAEGRGLTVAGRGADRADNETAHTSDGVNVDLSDPTVSIDAPFANLLIGSLTGKVRDEISGPRQVVVTYTSQIGEGTVTRTATIDPGCGPATDCTWSAPSPGTGVWSARAEATDVAGRPAQSASQLISVG